MPNIPSVLAILICDTIIVDALTQKKTLVGLFDQVWSASFPTAQRLGLYARLVDMDGEYKFIIRMVSLSDGESIIGFVETEVVKCLDRLGIIDLALNLPPVLFQRAGLYEFQLYANDDYIGRAVLKVDQQTSPDVKR